MPDSAKITQLQIRVTPAEKESIQRAAQKLNLNMSTYVLGKVLPGRSSEFQGLLNELVISTEPRFVLSEINSLLSKLNSVELKTLFSITLPVRLSDYLSNYVAAMVEYVCNQHQIKKPDWIKSIQPLKQPVFASKLQNLRLYLLTHSPAPFRRRNIFTDTTVGGQV